MGFKDLLNKSRMAPRGLRHKLWATFALGTIIPLLIMVVVLVQYAFTFYPRITIKSPIKSFSYLLQFFPMEKLPSMIYVWLALALTLALVGLYFIKDIIQRILKLSQEARVIVQQSNFAQQVRVMSEDEIGELRDTLNFIIARLQQNMQELEEYEKRLITSEKEKHKLLEKTQTLVIRDELTGLYNERYFEERWKEEIRRATLFQRPCSLISLDISQIKNVEEIEGTERAGFFIKEIGATVKRSLGGIEKVAYTKPGEFMIILPEKNKKEAITIGEIVITKVKDFLSQENVSLVLTGGAVSTPLDGVESAELIDKVREAAKRAYKESPGQILG